MRCETIRNHGQARDMKDNIVSDKPGDTTEGIVSFPRVVGAEISPV